jgi:hypothetical protein
MCCPFSLKAATNLSPPASPFFNFSRFFVLTSVLRVVARFTQSQFIKYLQLIFSERFMQQQLQLETQRRVLMWPNCTLSTKIFSEPDFPPTVTNYSPKKQLLTWHKWTTFEITVTGKLKSTYLLISVCYHLDKHSTLSTHQSSNEVEGVNWTLSSFKVHAARTRGRRK